MLEVGALIAFLAALLFALNSIVLRRGVLSGYVYSGTMLSIIIGVPMYLILSILDSEYECIPSIPIDFVIPFVVVGVLHFALGRYLYYLSVHYSGTIVSMPIMAMGQIIAAYLAIPLLGEEVTVFKITGLILATFGFLLFIQIGREIGLVKKSIILSSISALIFASTTLIIRYGLLIAKLPVLGVFISYSTALPIYLICLVNRGVRSELYSMDKRILMYLVSSAILVNMGQLFKYLALNITEVVIVGPIISTEIVLNLILSALINREYEIVEYRSIIGSIAIFLGIFIIMVSMI